jgi:hypothetical protein
MEEAEIRAIDALKGLPILDDGDPSAKGIIANASATSIAEAEDTLRLYELLHRSEYKPVAGIRYRRANGERIYVYFARLDDT